MFNTCSREPTHRPLTDTGGGYNLRGVGFPNNSPRPSQPTVLCFPLQAPPGLVNHANISLQQYECIRTYHRHVVFQPLDIYRHLCLCLAIPNDLPLQGEGGNQG
jgi:hypothetical protein